jgi:hypothetical protein
MSCSKEEEKAFKDLYKVSYEIITHALLLLSFEIYFLIRFNDRTNVEIVGKDLEGNSRRIIDVLSWHLPAETEESLDES